MTREDAIYWIKNLAVLSNEKDMPQIEEALKMAVEALADRKTENSSEIPNNCETCGTPRHLCKYCIEEDRMWTPKGEEREDE